MKRSKMAIKVLLVLTLLGGCANIAQAAESVAAADQIYGNITQGHVGVSASVSLTSSSNEGQNAYTTFSFNVRGQYFLTDRLGLGPVFRLTTQSNYSDISVGPSVLYYFWTRDRLGLFVAQDVAMRSVTSFGKTSSTARTESQLGLNYFLYPSVAIGPAVDFIHQFGTAVTFTRYNQVSVLGQFSIYL